MSNLEIWNKFNRPPRSALKQIASGRLRGKTDINPQWRIQAMTEAFGVCGIGWKYSIHRIWHELIGEEILAFAEIHLQIKNEDSESEWSEPIAGIGGSKLLAKESAGLHSSDEGYKMAITDALSVAMKMIGVGADIYLGRWDGSKYTSDQESFRTLEKLENFEKLENAALCGLASLRDAFRKNGCSEKDEPWLSYGETFVRIAKKMDEKNAQKTES